MTDLLSKKNTEGVNFQSPNTSAAPPPLPRRVYCEYPRGLTVRYQPNAYLLLRILPALN